MRQSKRYLRLCCQLFLAIPLQALGAPGDSSAAAADASTSGIQTGDADELRRELAGHNFIPSRFSLDPFVQTSVSSETGFGYGWANGKAFDINGNPVSTATYQVGAFAQLLDFQYGFLPWWAIRVGTEVAVYSGLNGSGVVGVGTSAITSVGLGTTLSWKVGQNLRFAGSVDVAFGPSVFFNIVEAVVHSLQQGHVVAPVNSSSQFTLKPAFVGAWAINRPLGLTFSLAYKYTHSSIENVGVKANLLAGNAIFDFDMAKLDWVPIGLLGGFETEFSVNSTAFLQFRYQFGIFYTGVRNLNVGVEMVYQRAPIVGATEVFLSSLQALIDLQYNFN